MHTLRSLKRLRKANRSKSKETPTTLLLHTTTVPPVKLVQGELHRKPARGQLNVHAGPKTLIEIAGIRVGVVLIADLHTKNQLGRMQPVGFETFVDGGGHEYT
jgi:hypothetical protein